MARAIMRRYTENERPAHGFLLRERDELMIQLDNSARNEPSLAVALNCGIGSSSLNALVKAFERLHIVRGENSSYCGSK